MRAIDREAQWLKSMQRLGEFIDSLDQQAGRGVPEGTELTAFNVRFPTEARPEALLVLKSSGEKGSYVAFVGGLTVTQALLAWRAKYEANKVRWREDVPWSER